MTFQFKVDLKIKLKDGDHSEIRGYKLNHHGRPEEFAFLSAATIVKINQGLEALYGQPFVVGDVEMTNIREIHEGLYIQIVDYFGKNGGFAKDHMRLWLVRIVGINGEKQNCSVGQINERAALNEAGSWARMLGCPIHRIEIPRGRHMDEY